MTKRARSKSPRRAPATSAHPIRLINELPLLHILSPEIGPGDAEVPELAPGTVTVHHAEQATEIRFTPSPFSDAFPDGCKGTLYVAESALLFWTGEKGFSVPYEKIVIHAISRGAEAAEDKEAEAPSVYVQLSGSDAVDAAGRPVEPPAADNGNGDAAHEEDEDEEEERDPRYDDEEDEMLELKLIPENAASLDPIFLSLSICAELHPDASSDMDDVNFPIFGGGGNSTDAETSASTAMARLLAAGSQIGQPGGPTLGELLGPGWITADSLGAAGDMEVYEGEGEGEGEGEEDEDDEGRFADAD